MSGKTDDKPSDDFDALIGELDTLAKSMPSTEDVDKIRAAAGEHGEPDGDENEDGPGDGDGDEDEDEEGGEPMAKSFRIQDAAGNEFEAVDGAALIKGLMAQQSTQQEQMTKSVRGLVGIVQKQDALLKSLIAKVEELGGQGRGRKSALSVHDRSDAGGESMAKSAPAGPSSHELLAKASVLCQQGKGGISGTDVARIEARLNRGEPIPPELVARINAAS